MAQIVPMADQTTKQKCKCIKKTNIFLSCLIMNLILVVVMLAIIAIAFVCIFAFLIMGVIFQYEFAYKIADQCAWTNITIINGQCIDKKVIPYEIKQTQYVFAHITHNTTGKQFVCTKEELELGCSNTEFKTPSPHTKCSPQFDGNGRTIGNTDDCYFPIPDELFGFYDYKETSKIKFGAKSKLTRLSEIIIYGWLTTVIVCVLVLIMVVISLTINMFLII